MVSIDVGESFELPHHTLLCSATGKTQEITSKWKCMCTCTYTLHMQATERSDKQNKQLIPPPHNTPSVRLMTTLGCVARNSSSVSLWCFNWSFHSCTPHLVPISVKCGKSKLSFLPLFEDNILCLPLIDSFIWRGETYGYCLPCVYSIRVWLWKLQQQRSAGALYAS